jgi:hypothetical protein
MSASKINKGKAPATSGRGGPSRTTRSGRFPTNSAINDQQEHYEDLVRDRNRLLIAERGGLFGEADKVKLKSLNQRIRTYDNARAYSRVNGEDGPGPEVEMDTPSEGENTQSIEQEEREEERQEAAPATKKIVDGGLGMEWDIDADSNSIEPALQKLDKEAFGHLTRYSTTRYLVRYGLPGAYSARFESSLPMNSKYNEDNERNVSQGSDRILEKILQKHRETKTVVPDNIIRNLKILVIYWDRKQGLGHNAEVEVLDPSHKKKPNTRCFIYLDPHLYEQYTGISNKTGYSHETRTTVKLFMKGNDDWQKSIAFHNEAVRLENKFEAKFALSEGSSPLCELNDERNVADRRSKSRSTSVQSFRSPTPQRTPKPTPERSSQYKRASTEPSGAKSPRDLFHADFLEVYDLPSTMTRDELPQKYKIDYVAQFTAWKSTNMEGG